MVEAQQIIQEALGNGDFSAQFGEIRTAVRTDATLDYLERLRLKNFLDAVEELCRRERG